MDVHVLFGDGGKEEGAVPDGRGDDRSAGRPAVVAAGGRGANSGGDGAVQGFAASLPACDKVLPLARRVHPDIVVLEVGSAGKGLSSVIRDLNSVTPSPRILVLAAEEKPALLDQVLNAGGMGCITTARSAERMVAAVDSFWPPAGCTCLAGVRTPFGNALERTVPAALVAGSSG